MLMLACACVGQKEDPENINPDNPSGPDTPAVVEGSCLVLDFTGTWCVNCPRMESAIEEAMEARPGLIIPVSVHCLNMDPMALLPRSSQLANDFGVTGYPSVVVDMNKESLFSATSAELLISRCESSLSARGKSAKVTVEKNGSTVTVTAKITQKGNYTLHLLVVEDGIVAAQTGGSEQHVHNNVLRQWIDAQATFDNCHKGDEIMFNTALMMSEGQRLIGIARREGIVNGIAEY